MLKQRNKASELISLDFRGLGDLPADRANNIGRNPRMKGDLPFRRRHHFLTQKFLDSFQQLFSGGSIRSHGCLPYPSRIIKSASHSDDLRPIAGRSTDRS